MARIPAFLMVILLLFSMIPVSFAQQDFTEAQAEADAHRDVNHDMKESFWFISGLVGSSVGFAAGGVGGCLSGLLIEDTNNCIYSISEDPMVSCSLAGAIFCGAFVVPAAVFTYPHNPSPPLERLLGKSPEYIEAYLHAYRSKTVSLRKRMVMAGSLTSNLGMGAMLLFMINDL